MKAYEVTAEMEQIRLLAEILIKTISNKAAKNEAYGMEQGIFSLIQQIGCSAMRLYFAHKGTGDVGPELSLPDGKVLKRESGFRSKDYFSLFGKIKIPRTCYRSREGGKGIMPLDAEANLPKRSYSYLLQQIMNDMSMRESFDESSAMLSRYLALDVSSSRFEDVNRDGSESYDQYYHQKDVQEEESDDLLTVNSYDGKGVPVIKEEAAKLKSRQGKGEKRQKKKEALVGVSYTIEPKKRKPEEVAQNLVYGNPEREDKQDGKLKKKAVRARNIRRMASLERPKEEVMREITDHARRMNPRSRHPWIVVMDGDLKLWSMIASVLAGINYVGILDIIHVTEYLWKAANALHGEQTPEARTWVYDNLLLILKGRVQWVNGGLKTLLNGKKLKSSQRTALEKALRYFENHRQWMKYDQYLQAGYPIGSGVVESTCAHTVKKRMEGAGRRWSIAGAESTLLLRSIYTSGDWQDYWQFHMCLERSFHYHDTLEALGIADDYDELGAIEKQAANMTLAAAG